MVPFNHCRRRFWRTFLSCFLRASVSWSRAPGISKSVNNWSSRNLYVHVFLNFLSPLISIYLLGNTSASTCHDAWRMWNVYARWKGSSNSKCFCLGVQCICYTPRQFDTSSIGKARWEWECSSFAIRGRSMLKNRWNIIHTRGSTYLLTLGYRQGPMIYSMLVAGILSLPCIQTPTTNGKH